MSGSFRPEHHNDFTGSTAGTAESSSRTAQGIIWRTRRHHADDSAMILRHVRRSALWHNIVVLVEASGKQHCVAALCAAPGVVAR